MTNLEWYFHNRRLVEHYEEEASEAMLVMIFMWSLVIVSVIAAILMAAHTISYWWIAFIPGGACFVSGILSFINYQSAKEMVEYIKWRM